MDYLTLILSFPLVVLFGFTAVASCGLLGSFIMEGKGRSANAGAVLGLFLGVVGVLVTLAIPSRPDPVAKALGPTHPKPPMPAADRTGQADQLHRSRIAA